jgi:hypothetical protein
MMKKGIVVRKCKTRRMFLAVLAAFVLVAITICAISLNDPAVLLLSLPILVIIAPMAIYFFSWQLHFEENQVENRVYFRKVKTYSYAQLREVNRRYYTSENNFCVCMVFSDGKSIKFRMDDDGAELAVKELQRHRSIKAE